MPKLTTYNASGNVAGPLNTTSAQASNMIGQATDNLVGALDARRSSMMAANDRAVAAQKRIDDRSQTISRVRIESAYQAHLQETKDGYTAGEDMSDPNMSKAYAMDASDAAAKAVESFEGSEEIRVKLITNLERLRSTSTLSFSSDVLKAGVAVIDENMTKQVTAIAESAGQSGDIEDGMNKVRDVVFDNKGAISSAKERAATMHGYAAVVQSVFDRAINAEDADGARAAMETDGITDFMSREKLVSMRANITTLEHAKNKALEDAKYKMNKAKEVYRLATGNGMSSADAAEFAGLPDMRDEATTLQESLDATRSVFEGAGGTWTPAMTAKHLNVFSAENTNAEVLSVGRARTHTANLAPIILGGEYTEKDVIDFIASTNAITQPYTYRNEDGVVITARPTLTQTTKDALEKLGVNPDGSPLGTKLADGGAGAPDSNAPLLSENSDALPPSNTIWGLAYKGTGVSSAVLAGIAHTPIIGDLFPADDVIQARTQLERMSQELVDTLRLSSRGVSEIKELEDDIALKPTAWETVRGFQQALIGLDINLGKRIKDTQSALDKGDLPRSERDLARRFVYKAEMFRDNLGLPPLFKSHKEAAAANLPPNTQYRGSDGVVYNTPREAQ